MSETLERVKGIVVLHLGVSPDKAAETAMLVDDLEADSLDIVELVMAFEEEFGIAISDDESDKLLSASVGDTAKLIDEIVARPK